MTRPDRLFTRSVILSCMSYTKPRLAEQLVKASGFSRATVWSVLGELRKEGLAHIAGWKKRKHFGSDTLRCGAPHALYCRGNKPDEPRPARLPKTEIQRAFRARAKAKKELEDGRRTFSSMSARLVAQP